MRTLVRALAIGALLLARSGLAAPADCPPATKPFTADTFAKAATQPRDRGLLWTISKGDRVSYLYGTFHLGREEWMAPGPALQRALRETEVIALELDPLDAQVQQQLMEAAKVRRNLSTPLKNRLKAAWDAQCLPLEPLESAPSELQVIPVMFALAMRDGFNPIYGSEILLSVIGQGMQRPVVSLESVASQMQALLAQDEADAARFIEDSLDDIEQGKARQLLVKTAAVWEQGDLAQLERYADWCQCTDTDSERKFMARVLDGRNPVLADRIDALHTQGRRVLAGVGAMHMVGPGGLPALLARRGYRVQRVHWRNP